MAPLVERLTRDPKTRGSNPVRSTINICESFTDDDDNVEEEEETEMEDKNKENRKNKNKTRPGITETHSTRANLRQDTEAMEVKITQYTNCSTHFSYDHHNSDR